MKVQKVCECGAILIYTNEDIKIFRHAIDDMLDYNYIICGGCGERIKVFK